LQQVTAALEALEHLTTPVIDRATLEQLLGIHRRVAIRLMHRFGGYQAGRTFLIPRPALIRQLKRIAGGDVYHYETSRRERLTNELEKTRRDLAARRITIPTASDLAWRELSGLPATIRLSPGHLEITCSDGQDLLRQLMELVQAITNEFEKFEVVVGKSQTSGG
jgi:hypothetical protein